TLSASANPQADYTLLLSMVPSACRYTLSASSQAFEQAGGSASVDIKSGTGCPWLPINPVSWITLDEGSNGSGDGTLKFTVAPNSSIFSRQATLTIAGRGFVVDQAGVGGSCLLKTIEPAQTIFSTLDESDCFFIGNFGDRFAQETYSFEGKAGDRGQILLSGTQQLDLALFGSQGSPVMLSNGNFTLPADGTYRI